MDEQGNIVGSESGEPAEVECFVNALDGHRLASTCFRGQNPDGPVVLINSGTAIPRRFYAYFAKYLASLNTSWVITYDYRGIGGSWPDEDRKFKYLMSDWARYDFPAIVDWIKVNHPGRQLFVIGHSFGGQTLGLSNRNRQIDRVVTVAAMSGYWRKMLAPERYRVFLMMKVLAPSLNHIYGYIPGKYGLGEDLCGAAMRQWAGWCSDPDYFFSDPDLIEKKHFGDYSGPLLAVGLDDDPWGRPDLIDHLTNHFSAAQIVRKQFSSLQAGGKVGHFNFFKPRFQQTLWKPVCDWLLDGKAI